MKRLTNYFNENGFVLVKLQDKAPIDFSKKILRKSNHENYKNETSFNKKTLKLQKELYQNRIHLKILKAHKKIILQILNLKSIDDLCVSSFFHLRAVKKTNKKLNSFVGIHRETFYSDFDYTKHQINISVPLLNYTKKNSMKVINKSHKIDDIKILTKKISSKQSGIQKFSLKHKLGFPYNPKQIIGGIDLDKAKRLNLEVGNFVLFSAMLLHGNGSNFKKEIRYSIDFALIKKKHLMRKRIKKHHASYSKSKKYWIKIPDTIN